MKIKRIEHVGVVVRDLEQSRTLWEDCLGFGRSEVDVVGNLQLGIYPVGESMVELLTQTTPGDEFSKLFAPGKEGLNHICFEVEDIDAALTELKEKGVKLLNEAPRPGHQGSRIAFLDPAGTGNVLIELVELKPTPTVRSESGGPGNPRLAGR